MSTYDSRNHLVEKMATYGAHGQSKQKQKKNRIQRIPQLFCPYAEKYPAENYAGKNEDPPGRKFQTADVNNWKHLASLVFELKTVSQGGSHADEFQAIRTLTLCGLTPWA